VPANTAKLVELPKLIDAVEAWLDVAGMKRAAVDTRAKIVSRERFNRTLKGVEEVMLNYLNS
jgi:hypothetical protein